jgi:hypothetical protein
MSHEMTIPRKQGETRFARVQAICAVAFTVLAILGLCFRVVPIASSIWLLFVMGLLWLHGKGGMRALLVDCLGALAGRQFVRSTTAGAGSQELTFGFELLGHPFVQLQVLAERIAAVQWSSVQAKGRAARDRNDWTVWLRFDHADPASSEKTSNTPGAEQGIWILGATTPTEVTEEFAHSFVQFLVDAGAKLVPDDGPRKLVRDG